MRDGYHATAATRVLEGPAAGATTKAATIGARSVGAPYAHTGDGGRAPC
jgi:hypothetical protein